MSFTRSWKFDSLKRASRDWDFSTVSFSESPTKYTASISSRNGKYRETVSLPRALGQSLTREQIHAQLEANLMHRFGGK